MRTIAKRGRTVLYRFLSPREQLNHAILESGKRAQMGVPSSAGFQLDFFRKRGQFSFADLE